MNLYMVLPFVLAIIKNKKGEVLIGQHANLASKPYPLFWDLPGGKLEEGESAEEGIKREVFEELGLKVTKLRLLGTFHHSKDKILSECTSDIPGLAVCFEVKVSGRLTASEQQNVHFAGKKELRKLKMTPWTKHFLKYEFRTLSPSLRSKATKDL